jgi:photosystem II stability/assembly factor-like uncharacterized protein
VGSETIANLPMSLTFDPEHPATWWENGIYTEGLYRTDDDGVSFRRLGTITMVEAIGIDMSDPARSTILAGIHEREQMSLSRDGGETWTDISASLPAGFGQAVGVIVSDASTFVVGTRFGEQAGVYRSTDGGASWTMVQAGAVRLTPVSAKDGTTYWARDDGSVISSADRGTTWTVVANADQGVGYPIVALDDGRLAAPQGSGLIVSTDRGATWAPTGPEFPYQILGMTYHPTRKAFFAWRNACADVAATEPIVRWIPT